MSTYFSMKRFRLGVRSLSLFFVIIRRPPRSARTATRFPCTSRFRPIADLYPMPRGPLARRLGRGAVERLDQARGFVPEPIVPVLPFDMPEARRSLLEPIGTAEEIGRAHV